MDFSPTTNTSPDLTIVVPVAAMSGRLQWLEGLLLGNSGPVVIVHDKKDEFTGPELRKLAIRFPASTLIEGNFGSPGIARMAGLAQVTTSYVAFMDSDDETFGGRGARELASALLASGADICAGSFEVSNLKNGFLSTHLASGTFRDGLMGHPGIWRYVFRVDFLRKHNLAFTEIKMGEDLLFLLDAYITSALYQSSPTLVYRYNIGIEGQATNSNIAKRELIPLMAALENRYTGRTGEARSLISFLWVKTFLSAGKNLVSPSARFKLLLYFFNKLFRQPQLVMLGLVQMKSIIQNAGSLSSSLKNSNS